MVTSVNVRDPLQFSIWVTILEIVFAAITVALLVYVICMVVKSFKKIKKKPPVIKVAMSPYALQKLKETYSKEIGHILGAYQQGAITKRDGYQKLSAQIREFIHEATGINVETLTVSEVKALGIRKLDELMAEYYIPEFAEDEKAGDKDLVLSCRVAMGVIRSWS